MRLAGCSPATSRLVTHQRNIPGLARHGQTCSRGARPAKRQMAGTCEVQRSLQRSLPPALVHPGLSPLQQPHGAARAARQSCGALPVWSFRPVRKELEQAMKRRRTPLLLFASGHARSAAFLGPRRGRKYPWGAQCWSTRKVAKMASRRVVSKHGVDGGRVKRSVEATQAPSYHITRCSAADPRSRQLSPT